MQNIKDVHYGKNSRKKEQQQLEHLLDSKEAEFLVVYGRRRVGKTFSI